MATSSHRYPDWVMLDTYVRLNYPRPTLDYPKEQFRATHAYAETSKGDRVRVSFRAVPPPGTSRLYVRWTPRTKRRRGEGRPERPYEVDPRVVAAHRNAILLRVTLHEKYSYPTRDEFYLYTAHSAAGQPPSLRRLPTCKLRKSSDGHDSRHGLENLLTLTEIGLLCRRGEFVVADLLTLPVDEVDDDDDDDVVDTLLDARLCMFRSRRPDGWEATRPRIRHEKGKGQELIWWQTDAVVPCGHSLCYVDLLRGILFADVLSERPKLRYVRLPVRIPSGNPVDRDIGTRGCPDAFRNVCATEGGAVLRFVDVITTTVFVSGCNSPVSSSFAINLWKLVTATMTWEKESAMEEGELWDLQGYGGLPRVAPEYPFVSREEPNVVYLVLNNEGDGCGSPGDVVVDDPRIIVVDMLNRTLRSWFKYSAVDPFHDEDGNMASRNLAGNEAFIPCEFSKYLHVPETSSSKCSEGTRFARMSSSRFSP